MKVRNLAKVSVLSLALLTGCAKEAPKVERATTHVITGIQVQPKSFSTRMYEITGLRFFKEDTTVQKTVTNDWFDNLVPPEKRLKEDHWFSKFAGNVQKAYRKTCEAFNNF